MIAIAALLLIVSLLIGSGAAPAHAAGFTVNPMFSSYMVLQRDTPVPVFGTGVNGTNITVTFDGQTKTHTITGGEFLINLDP